MILDKEIEIIVKSSRIIYKLSQINISAKMNDIIILPIDKLWLASNKKINVRCDICGTQKKLSYSMYQKNIKKHNIYCCNNKCAWVKNKKTNLELYGNENYNNPEQISKTSLERDEQYKLEIKKKAMCTKLERYGDENYNNREKSKQTSIEKYGVDNIFKLDSTKEKIKQTNMGKYGVEDSRSSQIIIDKRNKTVFDRYGVEFYSQTQEHKDRCKKTSIDKYGVDSPNKSDVIKEKKKNSMLKKYGFISNSITEESKTKLKQTNLERYGVEYPMQVIEFAEKQQRNSKKITYYNENIYYQSSYEKHFLDYIKSLNILSDITRGPSIKYTYNDKEKMHYPDFFIEKLNLIIEIKSDYYYYKYLDKNEAKMNKCISDGYNYIFIINKNYEYINMILKEFNLIV